MIKHTNQPHLIKSNTFGFNDLLAINENYKNVRTISLLYEDQCQRQIDRPVQIPLQQVFLYKKNEEDRKHFKLIQPKNVLYGHPNSFEIKHYKKLDGLIGLRPYKRSSLFKNLIHLNCKSACHGLAENQFKWSICSFFHARYDVSNFYVNFR